MGRRSARRGHKMQFGPKVDLYLRSLAPLAHTWQRTWHFNFRVEQLLYVPKTMVATTTAANSDNNNGNK